jgi:hypothetical protein
MGGGGTRVNYNPPPVQKDDSFQRYLEYQQSREKAADDRAAAEKKERDDAEATRKASGAAAYFGFRSGVQSQLRQGLIGFTEVQSCSS